MTGTSAHDELALARDRKRMRGEYARANALLDENPGDQVRHAVLAEALKQATALATAHAEKTKRQRHRWRVPGAIAATLVMGIFATLISLRSPQQQVAPVEAGAAVMRERSLEPAREASVGNTRSEALASKSVADMAAPASPAASDSPTPWLERIKKLRLDGRNDEADVELKKFRGHFPDLEIPEAALKKPEQGAGSPY